MIDKSDFLRLANVHDLHCISIYLPTSDVTSIPKDQIRLKNMLSEVQRRLEEDHVDVREIPGRLKPVRDMAENMEWWKNSASGLAIFIYDGKVEYRFSPTPFQEFIYIADHLYLEPLAPFVHRDNKLYIMTLSSRDVNLFEAHRFWIRERPTAHKMPQQLEEVVGIDFEETYWQNRTGRGDVRSDQFTGHGAGNDNDKKNEYIKFFREVDHQLMEILEDSNTLLVLACVDYLFPIYQKVSNYKKLYPHPIIGNYDRARIAELHKEAIRILDQFEGEERARQKAQFHESLNVKKASYKVGDIIPAAIEGSIDALFIRRDAQLWGRYDTQTNEVLIDEMDKVDNVSLLNLAAVYTIRNGGKVFIEEGGQMPVKDTMINAVYRYAI